MTQAWQVATGRNIPLSVYAPPAEVDLSSTNYLKIAGGAPGNALVTDGSGTLSWAFGAMPPGGPFLSLSGGTMTGVLELEADPIGPMEAATKDYVDVAVSTGMSYQGGWQVAANVPDLTTVSLQGGYRWLCETADPLVSETPPVDIPGLTGKSISDGDFVMWDAMAGQFGLIASGGLTKTDADQLYFPLTGGLLGGGLSFGTVLGNNVGDLSRHIQLHTGGYGFNITNVRINVVAPGTGNIVAVVGGMDALTVNATGVTTTLPVTTGPLTVNGVLTTTAGVSAGGQVNSPPAPTAATHLTNKAYVDAADALAFPLAGGTMTGGLSFGSALAASPSDVSRHIALYTTGYGLNVTSGRLNVVSGNSIVMVVGGNDTATYNAAGLVMAAGRSVTLAAAAPTNPQHATNKTYVDAGDALALPLTGGTLTGGLSFGAVAVDTPTDLSRHLMLHANGSGLNINTGRMNLVAPGGSVVTTVGGIDTFTVSGVNVATIRGLSFGSFVMPTVNDFSRHIDLFNGQLGITITGGRLNLITNGSIGMCVAATDIALFSGPGLTMMAGRAVNLSADPTTNMQAATKQYVDANDALHLPLTGGALSNGLSFGGTAAATVTDLTRHIALFGLQYGINVTGSRLNFVTPAGATTAFVGAGNDLFTVSAGAVVTIGNTAQNRLTITPGVNVGNGVAFATTGTGGITMPVTTFPTSVPLQFINPAMAIVAPSQDGAHMNANNLSISSFNGIGLASGIVGQRVPYGNYAVWFNARLGHVAMLGTLVSLDCTNNFNSAIGTLVIRRSGSDQFIGCDANSRVGSLASPTPETGGAGVNVNDRFTDLYNNTYTVMEVDVAGGAATVIRMDTVSARINPAPANPVPLTAAPGFTGTGVTVNLAWTQPLRLLVQNAIPGGTLALGAAGGIAMLNPVTLASDPTAALGAATKQYVDTHPLLAALATRVAALEARTVH
jgi:hypothetical protein